MERYPRYKELYLRTFARMLEERKRKGKTTDDRWKDAQAVYDWWIGN